MNSVLIPVSQVQPVAPWLGGKRNLSKRICAIIDATQCSAYAEPFVGMGGIFLRRTTRPRAEFINDKGRDIANLFRILQRHYPQFLDTLRFQLTTRAEFNRLVETNPETLTDLERAARFLYLQRTAFGGKVSGRNFGVAAERSARFNLTTLEPMLEDLHSRLSGVMIECLDWADFIPRYDREGTLFYLDPPYWGCEGDYGRTLFSREDFGNMAGLVSNLKGRFIMSINDVPEIREIFGCFHLTEVRTSYTIARTGNDSAGARAELLVSNWSLKT
ncbi:DNA methyltransferase [Gemmobacter lanyuensis]|uniref:site-specific DNA-methyltransferase (adenine-specific) n=1 Tax=Gemmobacter lanyuensis TaxID=1054497 RepID=A0A918J5S3_9RHOB|nr:DNA adenine methylase [Gemmobacter lanyuensis]GGW45909.1 DNA methyltransferase [Gemmobacter lanyuensis]